MRTESVKKSLVILFSTVSILSIGVGLYLAVNSKLFIVQNVEIESNVAHRPVDDQSLLKLAAVPLGKVSLFQLNLSSIEKKLLSHPWIRDVRLQRRFLRTLVITVEFRQPQAVIQTSKGALAYVDADGRVFGAVDLKFSFDLPILSGFTHENPERVKQALILIKRWDKSPISQIASVSTVYWELERGYRLLVSYPLGQTSVSSELIKLSTYARTMIDLGNEVDANLEEKLVRLKKVFRYLSDSSIAARQIWADAGKKIVVKTVRGS